MEYVVLFGEILLIAALIGFLGVLVWLAMTLLHLKNAAVSNAGRIYKRPLNASKNLVATGKGIVQQETVRVKHMGVSIKSAASAVKEAAAEVKVAAETIHPEDLKPTLAAMQSISKVVRLASQVSHAASDAGLH